MVTGFQFSVLSKVWVGCESMNGIWFSVPGWVRVLGEGKDRKRFTKVLGYHSCLVIGKND